MAGVARRHEPLRYSEGTLSADSYCQQTTALLSIPCDPFDVQPFPDPSAFNRAPNLQTYNSRCSSSRCCVSYSNSSPSVETEKFGGYNNTYRVARCGKDSLRCKRKVHGTVSRKLRLRSPIAGTRERTLNGIFAPSPAERVADTISRYRN